MIVLTHILRKVKFQFNQLMLKLMQQFQLEQYILYEQSIFLYANLY
jgi:hypothetical protein